MKKFYALFLAGLFFFSAKGQTSIFSYGSSWKYLANGTNQGTAWTGTGFSDAAWSSGVGQFGYGDGDEATVVSYGPSATTKYITTYFRKTISIASTAAFSSFTANVKRDDGIIVYINGVERYRNNIAAGTVTYTTLASSASDDGATQQTFTIATGSFVNGNNTIAVEIHQSAANSSDISFDMALSGNSITSSTTLISYNSSWKYLDKGTNQGTAWRAAGFNDASWVSGNAQLGYGDGDEATTVSYGTNASNKYITTYFRKAISVPDISQFTGYTLSLKRDDGAVVYLNGTEIFRTNMPTGTISYTTRATAAASDDGNTAQVKTLTSSQIIQGTNTIGVEIHQNVNTSSDCSFDLELKATTTGGGGGGGTTATLTRGPYLNSALQNGIVIRWRTDVPTNSKVSYGTSAGSLTQSVTDNTSTTEHIISLAGLTANTLYYYNIGSTTQSLQGDAGNYFKTLPPAGSTQKVRVIAMGDMGNNSTNQINVRNAYLSFNGTQYTDAWLLLGDNAYNNGTDAEFQSKFFAIYQGSISKNHVLWPSPGNHDYAGSTARQADHAIPYYDMFTLPKNGEAGGLASTTEAFYSYNIGNVHFISLDSYGWETGNTRLYDTTGKQAVWLKQDLAANTQPWTVVYFHHPPYSKGPHNSDTDPEEVSMRQKIVPILERFKVDLVLSGHSHIYERSFLMNGHYGTESTFNPATHALSSASGKYNGTANSCVYIKKTTDARNGIVYAVVGSSGQLGGTSTGYPHNAMYYSNSTNGGALVFDVENNRLDAKWVCADGVIRDNFTIMKNVNQSANVSVTTGGSTTLTASWIGNYSWSNGATGRSITVSPGSSTVYTVSDGTGCLTDVFNVTVSPNSLITKNNSENTVEGKSNP
jgi:Calcineurin-like phosphoesterase/Purple acid Phosphatase, N-terminal domain